MVISAVVVEEVPVGHTHTHTFLLLERTSADAGCVGSCVILVGRNKAALAERYRYCTYISESVYRSHKREYL